MQDRDEFIRIASRHRDMVFGIAYAYMRDAADADDVAQNVFMKLLRADKAFESEQHARNWLARVTANECKSLFRKPWRRVEDIEDYAASLAMPTREHEELFTSVMRLPERYRVPLVLYYYGGFSTNDIAGALGVSASAVRTRISRARAKLKKMLEGDCHADGTEDQRGAGVHARAR